MDSPCIKQTVCKVLKIFQHEKYLVAFVLKEALFNVADISSPAILRQNDIKKIPAKHNPCQRQQRSCGYGAAAGFEPATSAPKVGALSGVK